MGELGVWLAANQSALEGLQALSGVILLIPAGLFFLFTQWKQLQLQREQRYLNLSDKWHDFLTLTLNHVDIGASDYAQQVIPPSQLTPDQLARRDTIFELLTSIFERAHLLYADRRGSSQWKGWIAYIDFYCGRADYREWFERNLIELHGEANALAKRADYDSWFQSFMVKRFAEVGGGSSGWAQAPDGRWKRARAVSLEAAG